MKNRYQKKKKKQKIRKCGRKSPLFLLSLLLLLALSRTASAPTPRPTLRSDRHAIDHSSVDRLEDEVGAVQGFRCHLCRLVNSSSPLLSLPAALFLTFFRVFSSPGAAHRSIIPTPAASTMKWEPSKVPVSP